LRLRRARGLNRRAVADSDETGNLVIEDRDDCRLGFVGKAERCKQEDRVLNTGVRPVGAATALLGAAMLTPSVPRFRKLLD
jgi:hypothetical protein